MENIDIRRPEIELAAAVGGAGSLIRFAGQKHTRLSADLEVAITDQMRLAIREASHVRDIFRLLLNSSDEVQTEQRLDWAITTIDIFAKEFDKLFRIWERGPESGKRLFVQEFDQLGAIVDDLRSLQETMTLGKSTAFQEEIAQAKREALR